MSASGPFYLCFISAFFRTVFRLENRANFMHERPGAASSTIWCPAMPCDPFGDPL
jgi:hypothetical protein